MYPMPMQTRTTARATIPQLWLTIPQTMRIAAQMNPTTRQIKSWL